MQPLNDNIQSNATNLKLGSSSSFDETKYTQQLKITHLSANILTPNLLSDIVYVKTLDTQLSAYAKNDSLSDIYVTKTSIADYAQKAYVENNYFDKNYISSNYVVSSKLSDYCVTIDNLYTTLDGNYAKLSDVITMDKLNALSNEVSSNYRKLDDANFTQQISISLEGDDDVVKPFCINGENLAYSNDNEDDKTFDQDDANIIATRQWVINHSSAGTKTNSNLIKLKNGQNLFDVIQVYENSSKNSKVDVPLSDGYEFRGWYVNGDATPLFDKDGFACIENTVYWDQNSRWIYNNGDLTAYAYWKEEHIDEDKVYVMYSHIGSGTLDVKDANGNPISNNTYIDKGTRITITATPNDGSRLAYIKCNDEYVEVNGNNSYSLTVNFDTTIRVQFIDSTQIMITYFKNLPSSSSTYVEYRYNGPGTLDVKDANGTSIASGSFIDKGTRITITIIPDDSSRLAYMKCNDEYVEVDGNNRYFLTVDSNTTIYAQFINSTQATITYFKNLPSSSTNDAINLAFNAANKKTKKLRKSKKTS